MDMYVSAFMAKLSLRREDHSKALQRAINDMISAGATLDQVFSISQGHHITRIVIEQKEVAKQHHAGRNPIGVSRCRHHSNHGV